LTSATEVAAALTNHRSPVLRVVPLDTIQLVPLENLDHCVPGHDPNILFPTIPCTHLPKSRGRTTTLDAYAHYVPSMGQACAEVRM
jgi:hypothetical protein